MTWINKLIELKKNNQIGFINSNIIFEESWNDFIKYRNEADKGRKIRWENKNLSIAFEVPGSPLMQKFKAFNEFRDGLLSIWKEFLWDEPAVIMSDILGSDGGLSEHSDPCTQIHLNCMGSTEWKIRDKNNSIITKTLNPGDIVYLPIKTPHSVKTTNGPRVGIAYSIKNEYIN